MLFARVYVCGFMVLWFYVLPCLFACFALAIEWFVFFIYARLVLVIDESSCVRGNVLVLKIELFFVIQ